MGAKLKRFFSDRRVLAVIGLLVVALLIWFVGDAIAFYDWRPLASASARLLLIVVVVLAWAAWEGFKWLRAWRANRRLLAAIGGEGTSSNAALSQREVAELKSSFDNALQTLKKARFQDKGGGRNYLYQLPWYMFVGAPGSGKTTALVHSGLRFPLAEKQGKDAEAVQGIGGTRNCDWWFTDEAVLLDTAGRWVTQSSNREVDAAAWAGFLALLKKFRPAQPLNGLFVTVSVDDLLTKSAAQRDDYARSVRARVQELYTALGVRAPIYVVVTKTDLLAGFTEFFDDLGREARAQVWGLTFDFPRPAGNSLGASFETEFDALVERLVARLPARLEDGHDTPRRATVFAFPQQFAALKDLLRAFLDEAFTISAFGEEPLVRGVYFTSGTQEGSPFDRVLGNISRAYGLERQVLPPAVSSGRSYFIATMLRGVVFAESDLTGRSAEVERRRARVALAAYVALALLTVVLLAGWTVSFVRNQALVRDVQAAADRLAAKVAALPKLPDGDVLSVLPALDAARAMPTGYDERDASVPWSRGFGLSQAGKLGTPAQQAYLNLLRDAFLPRVALRLEQQIHDAATPEVRYEALKTYLMLYDPPHLRAADVQAWVTADWERVLPRDVSQLQRAALAAHLQAALAQVPLEMVLPRDQTLIDQTRQQLAAASLAQRAYSRLKRLGPGEGVPDFRVSDAAGPQAALVFTRASGAPLSQGVPALYTVAGFDKGFRAQAPGLVKSLADEEGWVIGPASGAAGSATQQPARVASALGEVQQLYLGDYVKTWDMLLGDLRLVPRPQLLDSLRVISLLAGPDSPLKRLLVNVAKETQLTGGATRSAEAAAAGALDKVTGVVRSTVDRLMGAPAGAGSQAKPEAVVDQHFEPLRQAVSGPPGQAVPFDATIGVLKEYEVQLRAADEASKSGLAPPSDALIVARIKSEADRAPQPVRNLLLDLVGRSASQAGDTTQAAAKAAAGEAVAKPCKAAIEGRYPFVRAAAKEVPPGDFVTIFKPGGAIDTFVKTKLVNVLDMNGPVWTPLPPGATSAFTPETIANFQRAGAIRDAFFPGGEASATVQADLVLQKVDDGAGEVQITADGQVSHLQPGAGVRLTWPSANPAPHVGLALAPAGKPPVAGPAFDGPWAMFRFIDAGKVEGGTPDRQLVGYQVGDKHVTFELRSPSVHNPLRLPELAQFRCPA